jgi:signal transduction histidine kinase
MVTAGIWLIYAGVVLRVLVRYAGLPQWGLVALLFALYGLLLLAEPWLVEGRALRLSLDCLKRRVSGVRLGPSRDPAVEQTLRRRWPAAAYLFLQTVLVVVLFSIPPHVDFFAGLFIPLSLQAVLLFGRRLGYLCIALFPVAMFVPLTANEKGWPFALVMSCFSAGLYFVFGSYAHQVQRAEAARRQNQRLLRELQAANRQLQGYAAQLEELAAEQERGRLARELHDSVTQTVFSMNLTVQSARLLLARDPGRAAAQLVRLEELAAGAMSEIQVLVSQLRLPSVADEGLPAALRQLADERGVRDGLRVALEVNGEGALAETVAAGLYRIVQEALTNVAKHAGTRRVTVRLDLGGDSSTLEVEDHGVGFDPHVPLSEQGHLGLAGMAERAREIGWHLSIDSRPGLGTRIRVEERPPGGPR